MTAKEARRELERIAAELENVIAQLIERPAAVDRWPAALRGIAEGLQKIRQQFPRAEENSALGPLVGAVQSRMTRLEALIESAAHFYFGCLAVPATQSYSYAPDGAVESFVARGRLRLEA